MVYKRVKSLNEFKKLKPRKFIRKPENLEWDVGKEYYVFSPHKEKLTKRRFHGEPSVQTVKRYIIEETIYFKNENNI